VLFPIKAMALIRPPKGPFVDCQSAEAVPEIHSDRNAAIQIPVRAFIAILLSIRKMRRSEISGEAISMRFEWRLATGNKEMENPAPR
jgi:hypothetical protein